MVYPNNGILLSNEKEQITDICNSMDEFLMNSTLSKKGPDSKEFILYNSIYRIFRKRQNYWDRHQSIRDGCRNVYKGTQRIFWCDETILHLNYGVSYTNVICQKLTEQYTKRENFTVSK